jgi:hypothetical protein
MNARLNIAVARSRCKLLWSSKHRLFTGQGAVPCGPPRQGRTNTIHGTYMCYCVRRDDRAPQISYRPVWQGRAVTHAVVCCRQQKRSVYIRFPWRLADKSSRADDSCLRKQQGSAHRLYQTETQSKQTEQDVYRSPPLTHTLIELCGRSIIADETS